jgi:aminocarboxymuconate-semialdehyde decarboxylase
MSHGGGAIAFVAGRLAQAGRKRPWAPASLKPDGAFEAQLAKVWFDTHVNDDLSLDLLERRVGQDRLVYGTNFAGWDAPDAAHHAPPKANLADNARRLLRKAGP